MSLQWSELFGGLRKQGFLVRGVVQAKETMGSVLADVPV